MPILAYLSVVGSLLLGLLFVAEGQLGPPTSLSNSTQFHGVPGPWKAKDSTQSLTVRDAPVADLPQTALARGELPASADPVRRTVQPTLVQPRLETPKKIKQAAAPALKKKKIAKAAPKNRNRVAQSGPPPLFGTIW